MNFDIANFWCEIKAGMLNFDATRSNAAILLLQEAPRTLLLSLKKGAKWLVEIVSANLRKKMKAAPWLVFFRERNVCRFEKAARGDERCVTSVWAAAKESTSVEAIFNFSLMNSHDQERRYKRLLHFVYSPKFTISVDLKSIKHLYRTSTFNVFKRVIRREIWLPVH